MEVVVIGAGFVGLQEGIMFAKNDYDVTFVDLNKDSVDIINSKNKKIYCIIKEKYVLENWDKIKDKIDATTDYSVIEDANIVIIAINTPQKVFKNDLVIGLIKDKEIDYFIDFSPLEEVTKKLKKYLQTGTYINSLVTIYPGGTYERIVKPLEQAGFELGKDIYITHTPERIDPGNLKYNPENIPRNLGYLDETSLRVGKQIYYALKVKICPERLNLVELSKLYENAFRLINIAFAQESLVKYGEDIFKVIDLAATKPFGFLKFYPGPYAGGSCLVKDSIMYWYATKSVLVKLALIINEQMPKKFAEILYKKIKEKGYKKILFYGLGFKPGSKYYISRELNPIERVIEELKELDNYIEIKKFDPNIPEYSDFNNEKRAREWADIIIYWDYKEVLGL